MAVDVIVRTRTPTVLFPRLPEVEPGSQVRVYFNGTRAGNGDGLPGGEDTVDYTGPLAGPQPVWAEGHPHLFGGGFGQGGFAEPGAAFSPLMGFGTGPFGVGAFAIGGGYWSWLFDFLLRDGLHEVGIRILDSLGNERVLPDVEMTMAVEALPRPAGYAKLDSYSQPAGTLDISWEQSPDLLAIP